MQLERLDPQQFEKFCNFIYAQSGIRIDEQKVTLLSNRIRRRLKASGFRNFDEYYQHLTSPTGVAELEGFLDAITTNETFFFRTEKHFDWLKEDLIAKAVTEHRQNQRAASLRILSAGCANGAEPYSIAMCLAENRYRLADWSLNVIGCDISEAVLREAREGVFKRRAIESVPDSHRRRFFRHVVEGDRWQVRSEIKQLVEFKKHNLLQPIPGLAFDCVFVRNVLIYFDRDSKQIVLRNVINALANGGYLVLGPSEGLYDMLDSLKKVSPLVYQKNDPAPARTTASTLGDPAP